MVDCPRRNHALNTDVASERRVRLTFTCSKLAIARSTSQSLFFRQSSAYCRLRRVRRITSCIRARWGCGYAIRKEGFIVSERQFDRPQSLDQEQFADGLRHSPEVPKPAEGRVMAGGRRRLHALVRVAKLRARTSLSRRAGRIRSSHPIRLISPYIDSGQDTTSCKCRPDTYREPSGDMARTNDLSKDRMPCEGTDHKSATMAALMS